MKVIASKNFIKIAGSFDDQPGFVDRDQGHSSLGVPPERANEGDQDIIDRWENKKKSKKKKPKMKQIYQLGLKVPESPREEAEKTRTYESKSYIKSALRNNS